MTSRSSRRAADGARLSGRDVRQQSLVMIEVNEVALIEFFGVAPEPQSQDEREFFAALLFIKRVDGLELRVSISAHFCDLRFDLRRVGQDVAVLNLVVPRVRSVGIERSASRQWLRAASTTHGVVELTVEPSIEIKYDGSISA
ncbi:MAG: hypothetical protein IT458_00805 [Planctomycetes bacterium]|nr:hypothetical protein [Planctomycetota bacterium]